MTNITEQMTQIIAAIEPMCAEATKQCKTAEKPYRKLSREMQYASAVLHPDYEEKEAELERLYKIYDKASEKAYVLKTVRDLLEEATERIEQYLFEYES